MLSLSRPNPIRVDAKTAIPGPMSITNCQPGCLAIHHLMASRTVSPCLVNFQLFLVLIVSTLLRTLSPQSASNLYTPSPWSSPSPSSLLSTFNLPSRQIRFPHPNSFQHCYLNLLPPIRSYFSTPYALQNGPVFVLRFST